MTRNINVGLMRYCVIYYIKKKKYNIGLVGLLLRQNRSITNIIITILLPIRPTLCLIIYNIVIFPKRPRRKLFPGVFWFINKHRLHNYMLR